MVKREIASGILCYQFPPAEGKHFGFSLHVLLDEQTRTALIIDTAYESQASAVRADLTAMGYGLTTAVISHFHPDHIVGLQALPDIEIVGNSRWEETLFQFGSKDELTPFFPTQVATESTRLAFGPFNLGFRPAPGHSACSQYTIIDNSFVHVADNVMTSNEGQDILPWAEFAEIADHIASLELLRTLANRTFLLSHGRTLDNKNTRLEAIDNRIRYFQNVLDGDGAYPYEQATRGCTCEFLHQEWFIQRDTG
ncbi:MBL fold metallo-hydrolase [Candidatus Bipolaricaulota bacterium]|nr:MBL fold metallo-hydrolase [Candidatus Bipolaricaulota bacterium]